ncbi:hypothetical protein E1162_18330 [Rhodobacteraceae bacterium RKSG542]|uniref:hypothetical protein n=1 Tax=Pseudovibrio flavus TaxID=2529854 RepID=UPI0012BBED7B|nr:hypothetical protein [Pseudovibrio flavus]MTI19202.1 hypothetical protein [Pseudovibrio flavus]
MENEKGVRSGATDYERAAIRRREFIKELLEAVEVKRQLGQSGDEEVQLSFSRSVEAEDIDGLGFDALPEEESERARHVYARAHQAAKQVAAQAASRLAGSEEVTSPDASEKPITSAYQDALIAEPDSKTRHPDEAPALQTAAPKSSGSKATGKAKSSPEARLGGTGEQGNDGGSGGREPPSGKEEEADMADTPSQPDTSALNAQIVQAAQLSNAENSSYSSQLISVPADVMATQTAGHATQNAESYMNSIMQIAVAAQAVVAAKIAASPATAGADAAALTELQGMVSAAISAYGTASEQAGTSAAAIISKTKV